MVGLLSLILQALDRRKSNLLLVAQASLPESQFQAFRKIVLNEFGKSGLQAELEELFKRNNKER
ncbi:MAG: hypothetical protein J0L85_10595 [Zoogloea sp.]|nr:hypothetical protein [Zoogloea sp.]MCA0184843.1 hypothetical protein [Pseudomonadota bacterium]